MIPLIRTARQGRPKARSDDNWVDRMSSRYTVLLLLTFTVLMGIASWVRTPMTCWFPKNFDKDERYFLQGQCWVQNAYYLPYTRQIPKAHEDKRQVIIYYQWVPWILLAQAFLFWFPSGVWHWLSAKSGLDTNNILEMSLVLQNTNTMDTSEKRVKALASYLDYFLSHSSAHPDSKKGNARYRREPTTKCCSGSFLTFSYVFIKVLYLGNLIFQMFLLTRLLKTHYYTHGAHHFHFHGGTNSTEDWNSPIFPRVAFCDYVIRDLGNNRRYTAQCVLTFNIYLERLYLFLWFWIVVLLVFTAIDFIVWFLRNVVRNDRLNFVHNQLQEGDHVLASRRDRAVVSDFVNEYLRHDGTLVLRLIAQNTSAMTSADVAGMLWGIWSERRKRTLSAESMPENHKRQ